MPRQVVREPVSDCLVRLVLLSSLVAGGCVQPFDGSIVLMTLGGGFLMPGDDGRPGRPPSDTHFEMYVVADGQAWPIFEPFDVKPLVDMRNPCQIDDPAQRWVRHPGIHYSQMSNRLLADALLDGDVTDEEAADIAEADERIKQAIAKAAMLSVVSHEDDLTVAQLEALHAALPPISAHDDASNAARLTLCTDFFREHPDYFIGSDLMVQTPFAGRWFGLVEGIDTKNNVPAGGVKFTDPMLLDGFDHVWLNWAFNDPQDARIADYGPSAVGYHYMAGEPMARTRNVIHVPIANRLLSFLNGELAISTHLVDSVEF